MNYSDIYIISLFFLINLNEIHSHGYLLDPPSRTSAWRVSSNYPTDYTDNQMNCGGFDVEWNQNSMDLNLLEIF